MNLFLCAQGQAGDFCKPDPSLRTPSLVAFGRSSLRQTTRNPRSQVRPRLLPACCSAAGVDSCAQPARHAWCSIVSDPGMHACVHPHADGRGDAFVFFVGARGSGKSTLLNRFLYPSRVSVRMYACTCAFCMGTQDSCMPLHMQTAHGSNCCMLRPLMPCIAPLP